MNNAKIRIADFPEEKSLNIQMTLIGENSVSYGELADLQGKTAEDLWEEFGDVPIDNDDYTEQDWYSFPRGTNRFEIWTWFEEAFDLSVAIDLMHLEEGEF